MSYFRPAGPISAKLEIRKSRFICYLSPVSGRAAAERFVQSIKTLHPKASHNCWSYIAGTPSDASQWNCSDDGEPKGTAGQPMLNILQHSGHGELCAVVTRYFGGIKLGTGGLVRAYAQAVQEALKIAEFEEVVPKLNITLQAPYEYTGDLEQLVSRFNIEVQQRSYDQHLILQGIIEQALLPSLQQSLEPVQHKISLQIS
ncbi:MAG: YigZ family protein [Amphritea sp.]